MKAISMKVAVRTPACAPPLQQVNELHAGCTATPPSTMTTLTADWVGTSVPVACVGAGCMSVAVLRGCPSLL